MQKQPAGPVLTIISLALDYLLVAQKSFVAVCSRHCGVDLFLLYNKLAQYLITGYHMGHRLLNNYCVIKYNLTLFYYYVNISVALKVIVLYGLSRQ